MMCQGGVIIVTSFRVRSAKPGLRVIDAVYKMVE